MNFLVIDGTQDKINFFSYFNNNSYNKSFQFSKNNNEKFSTLLFSFLNENNINLNELNKDKSIGDEVLQPLPSFDFGRKAAQTA